MSVAVVLTGDAASLEQAVQKSLRKVQDLEEKLKGLKRAGQDVGKGFEGVLGGVERLRVDHRRSV